MGKEATAKIHALPETESKAKDQPVIQVPAIGASIAINIGGDRQLTLQGFFDRDGDEAEANRLLDKMRRLAQRQKAFSDIDVLKEEIAEHKRQIGNYERDIGRCNEAHDAKQTGRGAEIELLRGKAEEIFREGYAEHAKSGRTGEYKPRGNDESRRKAIATDIAKIEGEIAKDDNQRTAELDQYKKNIEHWRNQLAIREKRLSEAEALVK